MPIHWTRVKAGMFHHFHTLWIGRLSDSLNGGILPYGYYALTEQQTRGPITDVLTLRSTPGGEGVAHPAPGAVALADAPPRVSRRLRADENAAYRTARRTLAIRHVSNHEVVAVIEIVSPANKDRESSVRQFVAKAVGAARQGVHLLLIDLFPATRFDPGGLTAVVLDELGCEPYDAPDDAPLALASVVGGDVSEAFVEPVAVGRPIPEMPLFLTSESYVTVPLQPSYDAAYAGVPEIWRRVVEA